MSQNSEYVTLMQARMRQFDADMDALTAEAGARARAVYDAQVRELRATREAAQKRFQEFQAANESADALMHAGMEAAWETMQETLKKVSADIGKQA